MSTAQVKVPNMGHKSKKSKNSKAPKDKRVKAKLERINESHNQAIKAAKNTEMLLQESAGFMETEEETEKTFKVTQEEIKQSVDESVAKKAIDLKLDQYGPYIIDYSRNGRTLLIGGKKGHVAAMDWQYGKLHCELHLNETVNAVKHLHNDQYFAVAQKKYTFIYDKLGTELHRLKQHIEVKHLDFLPYHFLLTTAGNTGFLKYQDVSTGKLVSELRTKKGPTISMTHNPWNAVTHLGHTNGQVTLWSPSMSQPLAQFFQSSGAVKSISISRTGNYMACTTSNRVLKIWDLRNSQELNSISLPTPGLSSDISDTGLLSVTFGSHVNIYKDIFTKHPEDVKLYMHHLNAGSKIATAKFVPFEDLLCLGHETGVKNIIVPGAGEANFDSLEINPFETAKQRQESEVRLLMNKLSPDMITLDPNEIGMVDKRANTARLSKKDLAELTEKQELEQERGVKMDIKPKIKGKNSALRRHLRKRTKNVIDERKLRIEKNLEREKDLRAKILANKRGENEKPDVLKPALSRFD